MPARPADPTPVVVHGSSGRMGRVVTAMLRESKDLALAGLLELRAGRSSTRRDALLCRAIPRDGRPVVIDFSHPDALPPLLDAMRGTGACLVCGTTGYDEKQWGMLKTFSEKHAVFYDQNMSYGIMAMKRLLRTAAELLRGPFDVEVVECHHRAKRDRPSGTALALAGVIDAAGGPGSASIHSLRQGGVPGDHEVRFASEEEVLVIAHRAISRRVFARGALRAARFIHGKAKGMFSMEHLTDHPSSDGAPGGAR